MARSPSIFISCSHSDKPLAQGIASALQSKGATVWIDEGELLVGDSIIERISTAIAELDFVAAIVSQHSINSTWCRKEVSLALSGGLNREGVKVLPLRVGDVAMPDSLADVLYVQVDADDPAAAAARVYDSAIAHLEARHADRVATRRVAGASPSRRPARERNGPAPIAEAGPVRLVGVVKEGIGKPRNDGTAGSALYAVPFRLSRQPTAVWADHFVNTWNMPPRFTTMHRPGICRVSGDVVTLDGVTVEEVEKYHLETLKACLDRVNADVADHEAKEAARRERERQLEDQHAAAVDETLGRLNFE